MSWLFSKAMMEAYGSSRSLPELAEEYSEDTSLAGEQFAQLNVMPTLHKFWRNDKTMEFSDLSRFGLTLRLLTESHGEELLMSYLADFRARTSASPELGPESKVIEAGYGRSLPGLFAKFSPDSCSWKTAQHSLFAGLEQCLETWPRSGSMRSGECYQRPELERLTCAKESGLWPTPDASCANRGWSKTIAEGLRNGITERKSGAKIGSSLAWEPRLLEDYKPGRRLNPDWLEWLMGWPIAHTELRPLETDRFHEWQQQHSLCLQNEQALDEAVC
jgi:hypothetical protein